LKKLIPLFLISILSLFAVEAQQPKVDENLKSEKSDALAIRFAQTIMATYPDSIVVKKFVQHLMQDKQGTDPDKRPASWNYEEAVVLRGFENLWRYTGDKKYYDYSKKIIDHFINDDGSIRTYERQDYNSDQVTGGLQLITLYNETKETKYKKAADILREQIKWQPRTKEGGFWHKHKYPYQMWLDCMYMLNVYYAEYCHYFNTPQYFDDVANQFIWIEKHAKDPKTGLLYHGWDESKSQKWADAKTGRSPEVWGRSMGWYVMGLVEVLAVFPQKHPQRPVLLAILNRLAPVLAKYQDTNSGVWYQIIDKANVKGNYLEASGSTMFAYALAKAVRLGYLDKKYLDTALKGFNGILKTFVDIDAQDLIHIHKSCSGAGLGGVPYRSGTYDYYINEPTRSDDLKTIGPLMNLMLEMQKIGYHSTVNIARQ
jgi:unsaturated rhamnogalacturonyl hydrolase